jgi:aminopeptidase YwaD
MTRTPKLFNSALLAAVAAAVAAAFSVDIAAGAPGARSDVIEETAVRAHMGFLAGDAMNGRGSGTRDEWITATYIAAQLRRIGLEPLGDDGDYVQAIEIARTEVVGMPTLNIGSTTLIHGDQMVVMKLNSAALRGPLQKYDANTPVQAGAALLMPEGADPDADVRAAGLVLWHETPPARAHWSDWSRRVIIVGRAGIRALAGASPQSQASPSKIMLSADAYSAVTRLPEGSIATVEAATRDTSGHTWNAVGRLSGSGKEAKNDIILLSAHLDHLGARDLGVDRIYNGADDDASGTTAVLTLAETLAKGPPLKRTIVFAWFGSEEAGGYGARYFVEKPAIPLEKIVANLEFEMIGRPDSTIAPHTLWLTGWERTNLGPELAAHGARLVPDPHPAENFFERSDNIALARRGVVAQTVSSFGLHADYHQPSDDIAHIDFAHMTEAIQSLLLPVRWLADSAFRPEWAAGGRPH